MELSIDAVTAVVQKVKLLESVRLVAESGQMVGVIGPNGSGKTTLLRCVYRAFKPEAGLITLGGEDLWEMAPRTAAQHTGVVVQEPSSEFDMAVWEVVLMGRGPHKALFDKDSKQDFAIADEALRTVGLQDFVERSFRTLSGGEKQRALVARALCQQPKLLVMDEPTNHLDIRFQLDILDMVRSLGVTTLIALHDLNLAASYCDCLYVLSEGRIVASGSPAEVLTPPIIREVFNVEAVVCPDPSSGGIQLLFARNRP